MLNRALDIAKSEGGKKVSINFQVPMDIKEQFDKLCKSNNVSVTSMLTALMTTALEEAEGKYPKLDANTLLQINQRIDDIQIELDQLYHWEGPDYVLNENNEYNQQIGIKLHDELERLQHLSMQPIVLDEEDEIKLLEQLKDARKTKKQAIEMINSGDRFVTSKEGKELDFQEYLDDANATIKVLEKKLELR